MVLAICVLFGFKSGITEKVFGFWGHIHVTDTKISRTLELTAIEDVAYLKDSIKAIKTLYKKNPGSIGKNQTEGGVKSVSNYIMIPGIINRKDDLEGIILKGVDHEYKWENFQEYLREGAYPEITADKENRDILISYQTSKRLKVKVGDKLVVYFIKDKDVVKKPFKISGIYKTGLEEYDVKFVFVDLKVLQSVLGWQSNEISGYEIFIDKIDDSEIIADYIYEEVLPANLYAETIKEKFDSLFKWLEVQDMNAILILVLMTIVAIINMCTSILILILERSKMIGVLKALGMTDWSIRKVFLYNAFWILSLSLLIGNALGIGIALLQQNTGLLTLDETNYYLSEVPIHFNWPAIIVINVLTIVVTLLVLIVPTYLIRNISPIKILRFE